jgi:hypothetical protein
MRINEDIGINQNHLNDSASASARASPTLSMLARRTRPSATDFVWKDWMRFGRDVMSFSPRRKALLMSSFSPESLLFRSRSKAAATSSSKVNVVRMHQDITQLMP